MSDHQFQSAASVVSYALSGAAVLTLESLRTGRRFTYRVELSKKDGGPAFVEVLTGPDNGSDYSYLGTIWHVGRKAEEVVYYHGKKSPIAPSAPSAQAFAWFWGAVARGELPDTLRVYHHGRCGRCGRMLTVPESIASGLGPECAEKAAQGR